MRVRRASTSRREFLACAGALVSAFTVLPRHVLGAARARSPSDRLNLGFIGVGGRGEANLGGLGRENVVALCDVDADRLARAANRFPAAKQYQDFRRMFDEPENRIDGVAVSTPDHTHAVAAMAAITRKKHLYCEKPLAHSIREVRALVAAAAEHKVVTQLGNQGHASNSIRDFCEWIKAGAIGKVHTVHAACKSNYSKIRDLARLSETHDVPSSLAWDLWLGPVRTRPYHPAYLPGKWRGWMPFGCGVIGDWVCHVVDPVFWALDLGAPSSIKAQADDYDPKAHADTFPAGSVIEFEFAARGDRGRVTLIWYDGVKPMPRPEGFDAGKPVPETGAIVLGEKGGIAYGSHGAGGVRLFPEEKMRAFTRPPQTIPRVRGHYEDWLSAIRNRTKSGSDFSYGGPLTEIALLGIIATRLLGTKLEWDGARGRFANSEEANALLEWPYRDGWKL